MFSVVRHWSIIDRFGIIDIVLLLVCRFCDKCVILWWIIKKFVLNRRSIWRKRRRNENVSFLIYFFFPMRHYKLTWSFFKIIIVTFGIKFWDQWYFKIVHMLWFFQNLLFLLGHDLIVVRRYKGGMYLLFTIIKCKLTSC